MGKRDAARAVNNNFDLALMAKERQVAAAHDRLSLARIDQWVSVDDTDRARLIELVQGMTVLTSEDFVPNNHPPPMRELYKEVAGAVNKGFVKLWEAELVFIFNKEDMRNFKEPIHYSPVHWTTKVCKDSGRTLFESKDDKYGPALNLIVHALC